MAVLLTHEITFGDCDPAEIIFYPNTFRWMNAVFHRLLHQNGGHAHLCERLGAKGVGLVDASAKFKRPMREGELLSPRIVNLEWSGRTLTIHYAGEVDGSAGSRGVKSAAFSSIQKMVLWLATLSSCVNFWSH